MVNVLIIAMIKVLLYYYIFKMVKRILTNLSDGFKPIYHWMDKRAAVIHELMHYFIAKILFTGVKLHDVKAYNDGSGRVYIQKMELRQQKKVCML